jgi:hypothetical protein
LELAPTSSSCLTSDEGFATISYTHKKKVIKYKGKLGAYQHKAKEC